MNNTEPISRGFLLNYIEDALLPKPVKVEQQLGGEIVMVGGDPGKVIVRVAANKVSVAVYAVRWEGPHTPVVRPEVLGTLSCRYLPASRMMMALQELIFTATEIRRARYRKCERCGETKPPEWMHDVKTCDSCAERYLGVVH